MNKSQLIEHIYIRSPEGFILLDGYLKQLEVHYPYTSGLSSLSWDSLTWYNLTPAAHYGFLEDSDQLHWGYAVWEDHDPFDYWIEKRDYTPHIILKNVSKTDIRN
jgi:hypothetical protein